MDTMAGAWGYGPDGEPGYRSHSAKNIRDDHAHDRKLARFGFVYQQMRTWDWAFAQSGAIVTRDAVIAGMRG